MLNGG
ncbi:hypothetical protein YPPY64_1882, partial [Yersinia pestis PY-64]